MECRKCELEKARDWEEEAREFQDAYVVLFKGHTWADVEWHLDNLDEAESDIIDIQQAEVLEHLKGYLQQVQSTLPERSAVGA